MKRLKRVLALILIVSCLLTAGAYAAAIPGEGLAVFEEVARMTPTTFSDLGSTHWGYYGIKVSYDRGLLVGDTGGTFRPEGTVTWAEAIAVASRIHSAYYANALNMNRRDDEACICLTCATACRTSCCRPRALPTISSPRSS